jgi:hypothetical protein
MPGSDSPPPFAIRFRAREPGAAADAGEPADRLYERTLELTALVAALADNLDVARFHLRDRLDRDATQLALVCRRAAAERAPTERRRAYREATPRAGECAALLDIIGIRLRRAGRDHQLVDEARALLAEIIGALDHLAAR